MRLLFSTTGGAGHFGPLAPIARACVAAGHEVRVAAPASFAGQVAEAGLAHAPFADVPPEVMGPVFGSLGSMSMEDANATVVREIFGRLDAQAALPGMREIVSGWRPDVILREPSEFAAAAMAEHEAIPHAEVAIGMSSMVEWASVHVADPLGELDDLVGLERGRTVAALAGAPVFSSVPASVDEARGLEWKAVRSMSPADGAGPSADGQESPAGRPAPTTDGGGSPAKGGRSSSDGAGSPAAAGPVGSAVRQTWRYRDADGPGRQGSLPAAWGDSGAPLVYVTFGSVTGGVGEFGGIFRASLDALADLPVRVLLTIGRAGDPDALRPWPANAHVQQWWPQEAVMPLASAMVGHGGFGTTLGALVAGVPQVVVPLFSYDQAINAAHVHEVGAGIHLEGGPAAMDRLPYAVSTVLDDARYRTGAEAVAAEIASLPTLSETVATIEGLAAPH